MIQFGKNIRSNEDKLLPLSEEKLFKAITSPKPESIALIRQLRIVRQIDPKQYTLAKRQLPYVVCGTFNPPYRRGENFASIEHFIIDIDHLSEKQLTTDGLKRTLIHDPHIVMLFLSPSGDGLKILFHLSEPCHDRGMFSLFYKAFAAQFASQNNIEQVVDAKTSDVTRACFLSYDPDAYYNPIAEPIALNKYIDTSNTLTFLAHKEPLSPPSPPETTTPTNDVISNIKQILALNRAKAKPEKEVFVPEMLNDIIGDLKQYLEVSGCLVRNITNIQYGKKIQTTLGTKQTETNLFYGKRGFSVVISPRTGTDTEANQLIAELIESYLATH